MERIEEQRVCVKFCFKLKKSSSETFELLQQPFGVGLLSRKTCFEWCNFYLKRRDRTTSWRYCFIIGEKSECGSIIEYEEIRLYET